MTHMIQLLPEDLRKHIYNEYIETQLLYDEYQSIIESEECRHLQTTRLKGMVKKILNHGLLIEYLYTNNSIFKQVYTDHIIKKKPSFEGLEFYNSFALSLLMNLYH
jgi:hypothetical protein